MYVNSFSQQVKSWHSYKTTMAYKWHIHGLGCGWAHLCIIQWAYLGTDIQTQGGTVGTQDIQVGKGSLYFILSIRLVTNLIVKEYSKRKCDIINISNHTLAHCGLHIPYSQYIAALVVIDCWPGQHTQLLVQQGLWWGMRVQRLLMTIVILKLLMMMITMMILKKDGQKEGEALSIMYL